MVRVVRPRGGDKLPLSKPLVGVAGKTGLWRHVKPVVTLEKCIKCYQCEIFCPAISIIVEPDTGPQINYDYCKGCGICADVCPSGAISMVPEVST